MVSTKTILDSRPKWAKSIAVKTEKAQKTIHFGGAGGGGGGTYLYSSYKGVSRPAQEYSQLSLLCPHYRESIIAGVYFRQTSVIYFYLGFSCYPFYRGVRKARVDCSQCRWCGALVIDDNVAKKDDDNKYDAAFSIILIAVKKLLFRRATFIGYDLKIDIRIP